MLAQAYEQSKTAIQASDEKHVSTKPNQMMRTALFIILLSAFSMSASGQGVKPSRSIFYSVGYFGESVVRPGIQISVNSSQELNKKLLDRLNLGLAISGYVHRNNHIGLRLTPQLSFLQLAKGGLAYGVKVDAGFGRRFYQGPVYFFEDNSNVARKYLAGQNSFTYGLYLMVAKNWYPNETKGLQLFAEIGSFQELYGAGTLLHPVLSLGISKRFK